MARNRALSTFGYALADSDDDWSPLAVTSRDMLFVEQHVKGFTAQGFFTNVTLANLYRVAYVLFKRDGVVERTTTFDEFVALYDIVPRDPTQPTPGEDDESGSETVNENEVDPTIPTA